MAATRVCIVSVSRFLHRYLIGFHHLRSKYFQKQSPYSPFFCEFSCSSNRREAWPALEFDWRIVLATVIGFLGSAFGVDGAVIVQPINHKFDHSYVTSVLKKHPSKFVGCCLANPAQDGTGLHQLEHLILEADKATIVKAALDSIKFLEETLQNLEKQKLERLHEGQVSNNTTTTTTSDAVVPFVDPSQDPVINNINDDEPLLVNQQQQQPQQQQQQQQLQLVSLNFFETWTSPNVTISMCGTDAHISICSLKKPGLFTTICFILNNHNHEIVSAQISSDDAKTMYMIHIRGEVKGKPKKIEKTEEHLRSPSSGQANVPPELAEGFPYEEMYKKAVEQIVLWINFEKL